MKRHNMELKVYELRINEDQDSFVEAIAIVENPAIDSNFLAFSKKELNLSFTADDEKMELIGAAMVPDMKIYRRDKKGEEYNVFFTKETIRKISQVFFKKGFQKNMNLDHTPTPAKSFVYQSYIVDAAKGMTSPKGLNLPDGTWVVGVKVEDKGVWEDIKNGNRKGFSVEGLFQFFEPSQQPQKKDDDEEILSALKSLDKLLNKNKANKN